jgi:hypothetical protein
VLEAKRYLEPLYAGLLELVKERLQLSNTVSHYELSFWALAAAGRARPSPLHNKKTLASKWY